jgi:hypothetical protein
MLYALLDAERGVFIRDSHGDVVSAHVFSPDHKAKFIDDGSPAAKKAVCILDPVQILSAPYGDLII